MIFSDTREKDGRSLRRKNLATRYCEICGRAIPRNTRAGEKRIPTTQYIGARFCSNRCRGVWLRKSAQGEGNPNWRGGVSPLRQRIRSLYKMERWSRAVRERDNFTCQWCGRTDRPLVADHIKQCATILDEYNVQSVEEALGLDELWDIMNGRTLCRECHRNTDTYCTKIKNAVQ